MAGALFIIMVGMGLGLVIDDFKRVLLYPKAVAVGLLLKVLLLPVIMFGILMLFPNLNVEIAVGFVLLAACPGGATSNLIAGLCRSDVALSITLTAFASFITVLTIPLFTELALSQLGGGAATVQLPIGETMLKIIGVTVLPVSIGMLIKRYKPTLADKADRPVRLVSAVILLIIIIAIVAQNSDQMGALFGKAGPLSILMNVIALSLGYGVPRLLGMTEKQAVTISIETGIINSTLAIAVASTLAPPEGKALADNGYAFAAAVYSLVMYASIMFLVWYGNKRLKA